jgi:mycothiol synthase
MGDRREVVKGRLDPDEVRDVTRIVDAATAADRVAPVGEHVMLGLRYGDGEQRRHVLVYEDADLAGYGQLDVSEPDEDAVAEMVVDPARRGRGHGRALAQALLASAPNGHLRAWSHGQHPHAERLAVTLGFDRVRTLLQMRRSLYAPVPSPAFPDDVTVRTFRVDADEKAWLAVNAAAFRWHPEQGGMTMDDLRQREAEPWFDATGFFLAERGGELVGFHWTKVHPNGGGDGSEPMGEVYAVGVSPHAQGGGLGRALTVAGLQYLRGLGLSQVLLYVEETNAAAVRLYESLEFTRWDADIMYRR